MIASDKQATLYYLKITPRPLERASDAALGSRDAGRRRPHRSRFRAGRRARGAAPRTTPQVGSEDVVGELGVGGHTVVRGWVWLGAVNQEILPNAREVRVKQPLTTTFITFY